MVVDNLTSRLAERLRLERDARGWSLAELAERSGVSRAMLSKIERREASPTAVILGRISGALGLTVSTLLARAEAGSERLRRAADQPHWSDPQTGQSRRSVSPAGDSSIEIVDVELPPGARIAYPAASYAFNRQQIWLRSGRLHFEEGPTLHVLEPGDCLELGPPQDCAYVNPGPDPARYIVVVVRR